MHRFADSTRRSFLALACAAGVSLPLRESRAAKPRVFRLVLDPGHGGENRGCRAVGGQIFEKDYTLAVCQKLRERLRKTEGLDLSMTRRDDRALSSAQRVAIANARKADLVLSIHANASGDHTQSGFESFVLDPQRAQVRRMLDANKGAGNTALDPVALRIVNHEALMQERQARHFAALLRDTQRDLFPGRIDRGVRYGRFDLLVECRRPTVLHELGFLDHRREGHWMQKAESMDKIVEGLAKTMERHVARVLA